MDNPKDIPLWDFRYAHQGAIPFEIIRIEAVGQKGWAPSPKRVNFAKPNRVNFYEVLWVTSGSGTRYIDFEGYPIRPQTFFCITPGQIHSWDVQDAIAGYVMLFLEEFLSSGPAEREFLRDLDFFHRIDHDPVIYLDESEAPPFQVIVDLMIQEYEGDQFGRRIAIQSLFRLLLIRLERHYQDVHQMVAPSIQDAFIDRFQRLIDQHYLTKRHVKEYADLLGMTAGHLTSVSREVTGLPAGALIRNRVILEAKRLLAHTDRTATQLCYDLNFDDPSYFGRFFKRETGQSPLVFRQSFRGEHQYP